MKNKKNATKKDKPNKKTVIKTVKMCALIFAGCILYSIGVALFLDPSELASGGATGISIMINYVIKKYTGFDFGTGWLILIINVPLFIVGAIFFGKKFIISSAVATAISSGMIELWSFTLAPLMPETNNMLIPVIVGGVLYGAGVGFIFKAGSSTGGSDIIIKLLHKRFRHIKPGIISLMIDAVIVGASAFIYKDLEILFYTTLCIFIFSISFDFVLYNTSSAKLVYIITTGDKADAICTHILKDLDIGATLVDGTGAYSKDGRTVILCAIKNHLYPRLIDVIKAEDPAAFTIVSSAKEIYGEGYKTGEDDI